MNHTYKALLKKLHEKYPNKHISISPDYSYYDHTAKYKTEYYVYVENGGGKHLPTLSEVKLYIEYLCKKGG